MDYDYKNGVQYSHTANFSMPSGRTYCYITCPFCQAQVKAFIWSLCGGGKKCDCGAKHGGFGLTYKPIIEPKKKK